MSKLKPTLHKLHRYISIAIFLPIALWAISGLSHPITSNWFRPPIANKRYIKPTVDTTKLLDLKQALQQNNIANFNNSHIVTLGDQTHYQILQSGKLPTYINAQNGQLAANADTTYAKQLARYFLQDSIAPITQLTLVESFGKQYKSINRLLPVWKVDFGRGDNMSVYVHTPSSRLGTYAENSRKLSIWFFNAFHNWGFIPDGVARKAIVSIFSAFCLITALVGLALYLVSFSQFKRTKRLTNSQAKKRRQHRTVAIIFSIFVIMFSFSGFWHALKKFETDPRTVHFDKTTIQTSQLQADLPTLLGNNSKDFAVKMVNNQAYYRIEPSAKKAPAKYLSTANAIALQDGDKLYSKQLALSLSGLSPDQIKAQTPQFKFNHEYGFINKRLPVQKIEFDTEDKATWYIEAKTGKLGALVKTKDRMEGLSFAFLHKFHFLDGIGKTNRDFVLMFAMLCLLWVSIKGILILKKS